MSWEIWLDTPTGERITTLDTVISLQATKIAKQPAPCMLTLPSTFDQSLLRWDGVLEFWRRPRGGSLRLFNAYQIRNVSRRDDMNGRETIAVVGFDPLYIVAGRIVAYYAGEAQSAMTDQADDVLKAMAVDNLGADAAGARNITANGVSVAADLAAAPSITKAFSWRPLLEEMREICDKSRASGTELYFDLVPSFGSDGLLDLTFTTYTGQVGLDRTSDSASPIYFGKKWGNLEKAQAIEDHTDEINYVYAGGQGTRTSRDVQETSDTDRIGLSIWNRREGFAYATDLDSSASVLSRGNAYLEQYRPLRSFSGNLLDTQQFRYGVDWQFGDRITAQYGGEEFDAMIDAVVFTVDENGQETLEARAEVEL